MVKESSGRAEYWVDDLDKLPLGVGTDFSGMAPIQAIRNLAVSFSHAFSSEMDPAAQEFLLANFYPRELYRDVRAPNNRVAALVDMYLAGPPCQSFSLQ